jgi:hypothetical protein
MTTESLRMKTESARMTVEKTTKESVEITPNYSSSSFPRRRESSPLLKSNFLTILTIG